jgi:hypothetical protein
MDGVVTDTRQPARRRLAALADRVLPLLAGAGDVAKMACPPSWLPAA